MSLLLCRTAMEKMKDIYEKNPQLGDSKVVAQQLLDTRAKIDTYSREIQEFKVQSLVAAFIGMALWVMK